jgi:competence protein ComEC
VQAGQVITFDDGVELQILSPPQQLPTGTRSDVDNASIALRLTYGERSFLLAGDCSRRLNSVCWPRACHWTATC